jgi:hypothetical protein
VTDCATCNHPAHGERCSAPRTEEHSTMSGGLIYSHIDTIGTCCCGLVDSLIAQFAVGVAPTEEQ